MVKKQVLTDTKELENLVEIWQVLTPDEQEYLKANFMVQHFKKNEIIHCEGDRPTHIMSLVHGKVKIYKEGVGGRNQILRIMQPVSYFAYRAILADGNYNASACAFESSTVIFIPKEVILKLLHHTILGRCLSKKERLFLPHHFHNKYRLIFEFPLRLIYLFLNPLLFSF